jgi:hypothetical protein
MYHADKEGQNATNPTPCAARDALFSTPAFTSVFRRLLEQAESTGESYGPAMRQARRLCGRWLVVRRLAMSLDAATVAERTEVGAEALHLLELGLADEVMVSEGARDQLVPQLAGSYHDEDWVAVVIDSAVGRRDACAEAIITRVREDLRRFDAVLPEDQ